MGDDLAHDQAVLYIDPDSVLRRFADAVLRDEYRVLAIAVLDEVPDRLELAAIVINLSDSTDPNAILERLNRQWPTIPVVVVLSAEAAAELDRDALWARGPDSIVVNPLAPGVLRSALAAALL